MKKLKKTPWWYWLALELTALLIGITVLVVFNLHIKTKVQYIIGISLVVLIVTARFILPMVIKIDEKSQPET